MVIEVGATKVNLYDTIKELPILRYQKFQEYTLIDSGIGKDITDIDTHFAKIDGYLVNEDVPNAVQERKNMHKNFFYMFLNVDVLTYSFCCLVKDVDGSPLDLDESKFDEVIKDLSSKNFSYDTLQEAVIELKKNYILK